jgi:hypothetical protein
VGKFIVSDMYPALPSNPEDDCLEIRQEDSFITLTAHEAWELGNLILKLAVRRMSQVEGEEYGCEGWPTWEHKTAHYQHRERK